ncbi:MAG TPA: DUF2461 domain-containing protein [Actinomycetota bacterium]|nr:DUF2461 domain-containing protein [Actinomycetota bacterium]
MATFRGWPAEALEFFDGLEEENTKAYWQRHKQDYETLVRAPMEALLADLEPKWGEGRIFRPYRDVRFSKDKSPYKTHIGAMVGDGYVQLSSKGLAAGSGMWEMAPDQLDRYRKAVGDDKTGKKLAQVVSTARDAGLDVAGRGELKTAPRGFPSDHPRIDLLRYKGLVTWREWPVASWLGTRRTEERLVEFFTLSKPMNTWLDANVGPSTEPPRPGPGQRA